MDNLGNLDDCHKSPSNLLQVAGGAMNKTGSVVLVICMLLLSQGHEAIQALSMADEIMFPTDVEINLALERAAKRTDQKLKARWMALLDSIMVEVHEQFVVEYKAEIDSLN